MLPERPAVLLADGPQHRASAARPLLDAAGFLSRPYRGESQGPALLLVDPDHPDARALLSRLPDEAELRAVALPDDARALIPALEEAALGLGAPELHAAARIAACTSALADAADPDALLVLCARSARDLLEAEGGAFFLLDAGTQQLVVKTAEGGAGKQLLEVRIPATLGVVGDVVQRRLPALVNAPHADPRFDGSHDRRTGFLTRNLAAVPVFFRGEVLGALEVVNRKGGSFTPADLRALTALALQVGIALNHTRAAVSLRATAHAERRRSQDLESRVEERTAVLERAKKEWEQTFDAIGEPVAILDGFVVRRANKAYARRAKLPVSHLPGRTCFQLLGRSEPCVGCPLLQARRTGAAELSVVEGRRDAVATYAISDGGTVMHYRDVTEARALESKLRDTDRLAVVGQLAAGAAHEINNPLGFVSSNLASLDGFVRDLAGLAHRLALAAELAGGGKGTQALAMLARMHAQGEHQDIAAVVDDAAALIAESQAGLARVADIVRALKELAKQELQGTSEPVALQTALQLALRTLAPEHAAVRAQLLAGDEGLVRGQPLQLQQAIQAVLKNALQAAQQGGGTVELCTRRLGGEVQLTISDDGPGIDPALRARVFEPFFTTRGIGGGVGLGLTAAYGIVTRHGGRIELSPRAGGGTVATLSFPSAIPARPATEAVAVYRPAQTG